MLAYGIGGALAAAGVVVSFLYTGSALATTAIGTLIPILRDAGELRTRFGSYLLGAGAVGEFGPILLITLVLSTTQPLHEAVILIGFIVIALLLALTSVRLVWRGFGALERTLESSSQLAVRIATVLVFGLVLLASELGLDILLGGFVAGMIVRAALRGRELEQFESKLTAVGFGFLIPFFFVESGIEFDLEALGSAAAIAKLFLFLALFLVVRGAPGDRALPRRARAPVTGWRSPSSAPPSCRWWSRSRRSRSTLGEMRSSTAAGLVGAAMLSTLIYPFVGLALRRREAGGSGTGRGRGHGDGLAQSSAAGRPRLRLVSERRRLTAAGARARRRWPSSAAGACGAAAPRRSAPAAARRRARGCAPGCGRPGRPRSLAGRTAPAAAPSAPR